MDRSAPVFSCSETVKAGKDTRQDKDYQQDGACGADGYCPADLLNGRLTEAIAEDSRYGHYDKT